MKLVTSVLLIFWTLSAFAQDIQVKPEWSTINGKDYCVVKSHNIGFHTLPGNKVIVVRELNSGVEQRYSQVFGSNFNGHTFKLVDQNVLKLPQYLARTASQGGGNYVGFFNVEDLRWVFVVRFSVFYFDSTDGFIKRCL